MAHGNFIVTRLGDDPPEPPLDPDEPDQQRLADERILREPGRPAAPTPIAEGESAASLADERILRGPKPEGPRTPPVDGEPGAVSEELIFREPVAPIVDREPDVSPFRDERIFREAELETPTPPPDADSSPLIDERIFREPWRRASPEPDVTEPELRPFPFTEDRDSPEPAWEQSPESPAESPGSDPEPVAAPPTAERILRRHAPDAPVAEPFMPSIARERVVDAPVVEAPPERRPTVQPEKKRRRWGRMLLKAVGLAVAGGVALTALGLFAYRFVDPPYTLTMAIRAVGGADIRREVVPLERISPHLVRAVIAAEDARFCLHRGFDQEEMSRAIAAARRGEALRGASTISQQTAKNAFLWTGGGFVRKGAEAALTGLMELTWPKPRIMEVYLNEAEWGDGLFGAEAAAQGRFGKSAAELTAYEAALLAAVLPSPNRYRLDPPTEFVRSRAGTIQARMDLVVRDGLAACVLE